MNLLVVAAHLGALHPAERALTAVLLFGPFVVLGVVVVLRQRALRDDDEAAAAVHVEDAVVDRASD